MENSHVRFGEHPIDFVVSRRNRKSLEISVEPDASVVVVAPVGVPDEVICEKVKKRASWIIRQQRTFSNYLPKTPDRQYVSGETHLYLGRQYRLKIVRGTRRSIKLTRGFITVVTREPGNTGVIRNILEGWYRDRANVKFAERLEESLKRFPNPDAFRPLGLEVRYMKQRWGSMSSSSKLLLNCRLIQASIDGIDYVITHELCHIAEPHHGPDFYDLLNRVLPDWPKRKIRLEERMS